MTTRFQKYLITKKSELLKSALNRSPVQFAEFSHRIWILKLSPVKVRGPELPKNRQSIRAAQKFDPGFGNIFIIIGNPIVNLHGLS